MWSLALHILTFFLAFAMHAECQVVGDRFEERYSSSDSRESFRRLTMGVARYMWFSNADVTRNFWTSEDRQHLLAKAEERNASRMCLNETERLLNDIIRNEFYALTMIDSVGKPPPGILGGALAWYGDYDGCLNITAASNNGSIQGKYCMVSFRGQKSNSATGGLGLPGLSLRIGVCVPSACDAGSVKALIEAGLYALRDVGIQLEAKPDVSCPAPIPYTNGDIITFVLIGVILLLLFVGAVFDLIERNKFSSAPEALVAASVREVEENESLLKITTKAEREKRLLVKIMIAFSPITNGEKILGVGGARGDIRCIHGIRTISMWWVILGHVFAVSEFFISNPKQALKITKTFAFQAVGNATFSVDTFFLLSGLLLTFLVMKEMNRSSGKMNWCLFYFHRFWRLTPLLMFVILLNITVLRHVTTGPATVGQGNFLSSNCEKYWWTNLLYINNFYPTGENDICLIQTWYLANDMQFFVISPILLVLLSWNAFVGIGALVGTVVASMIIIGMFSTYWGIPAFPNTIAHPEPRHGLVRDGWDIIYDKPYCRIQSYAIGMMLGYVLYLSDCKPISKIRKVWVALGWLLAAALCLAVLYGTYWDIRDGVVLPYDTSSFYNCAARVGWCLGVAWVIYTCVHGYGGPVNHFLSWSGFIPISRLTYAAYLIHVSIVGCILARQRVPLYFTYVEVSYQIIGHVVVSYAAAFILSLMVEAPMISLEKIIFRRK